MADPLFISIGNAAAQQGCHTVTLKRLIKRGKLAPYVFNNRIFLKISEWQACLEAARHVPASMPKRKGGQGGGQCAIRPLKNRRRLPGRPKHLGILAKIFVANFPKQSKPVSRKLLRRSKKPPPAGCGVGLSSWRGKNNIELRECTASVPGNYWPTSSGISLSIDKLDELIAALSKAKARAVSLGLLSDGGLP
jgi:hypothetical protein